MSHKKTVVQFRRKRNGRTNYRKRLELLKSRKTRLVVRLSNNQVIAQLVDYSDKGDQVKVSCLSSELQEKGWKHGLKNIPAAYLTGLLLAKKAKGGVSEAILDIGLHSHVPGSRLYAVVKGVVDGGLNVPVSQDVFPADERISGTHIKSYAEAGVKGNQFSKSKTIKSITDDFSKIKEAVLKA
ncbi:50S ribosomal protein L18 [Candidatus Woesearchaeota archaeon]|nr:50S ribosomal protein L18 [Candidatus Woesearchaeota archaeon]